uniref:Uncharacterized protein n=1 Tax=Anguilla anguilla TaxID=7936 RepID=A0A0E9PTP0_ANGAN
MFSLWSSKMVTIHIKSKLVLQSLSATARVLAYCFSPVSDFPASFHH